MSTIRISTRRLVPVSKRSEEYQNIDQMDKPAMAAEMKRLSVLYKVHEKEHEKEMEELRRSEAKLRADKKAADERAEKAEEEASKRKTKKVVTDSLEKMNSHHIRANQCFATLRRLGEKQREETDDKSTAEGSERRWTKSNPIPKVGRQDAQRAKPFVDGYTQFLMTLMDGKQGEQTAHDFFDTALQQTSDWFRSMKYDPDVKEDDKESDAKHLEFAEDNLRVFAQAQILFVDRAQERERKRKREAEKEKKKEEGKNNSDSEGDGDNSAASGADLALARKPKRRKNRPTPIEVDS